MYQNTALKNYLEQSSSVNLQSLVIAEWNMNFSDNILLLGNYRNRPSLSVTKTEANFGIPALAFDSTDALMAYTGATESEIVVNTGLNSSTSNPTVFMKKNQTEELLFSLKDCVSRFRPRSGINKLRFFPGKYLNAPNENMFLQPRYYLSSKDDKFKYWNSYRVEADTFSTTITGLTATLTAGSAVVTLSTPASTSSLLVGQFLTKTSGTGEFGTNPTIKSIDSTTQITLSVNHKTSGSITFRVDDFFPVQRGIATQYKASGEYYIDDTAPFVVYDKPVPANRIVVKMQTNASDYTNPDYKDSTATQFSDPFYEDPTNVDFLKNQTTPEDWAIQYLDSNNTWQNAKVFTSASLRTTGKRVIGADGYVEIAYGITNTLPSGFRPLGEYASQYALPASGVTGDAYLVPDPTNATSGTYYVWNGSNWTTNSFVPTYGWMLVEEGQNLQTPNVTSLTSPDFYGTPTTAFDANYREFKYVKGIRIVVNTMSKQNSMFDLIEMSPRLVADLSDKTTAYSITKIASDIGNTGIPVGQLLASTGNISIFDYDQSFNEYNDITLSNGVISGSIISDISSNNLQFKFYEHIIDDRQEPNIDYFVPIKTMYVNGFPKISNSDRMASLELRDFLFHFESQIAPSLLMRNVKLSKAISTMLDAIGFTNYKFYRNSGETDEVIPYFYIAPETNVATVLNELAKSTQTCMFFNENNDLITMSKNYIMPSTLERQTDLTLYATKDYAQNGITRNAATQSVLSNIISLDSEDNQIFNGGKITYENKYIQKSYGTIKEASLLNSSQSYKYKPVLLWEVAGTEAIRPTNDEIGNQSSYTLSALALKSELTDELPYTDNAGVIKNNIMDFGQTIYWLTRYKGYFYANGEIIKYQGVEHTIQGNIINNVKATLETGTNIITVTSGNIYNLAVGQTLAKSSGTGQFGASEVKITGIDYSKNMISVSASNLVAGAIVFTAKQDNLNVWINDVNEYQQYFAKLPFNGKLFPTGRVKIYAEPKFDPVTGAVVPGPVAKHGRMQFGTGVYDNITKALKPAYHTALDESNEWLQTSKHRAFAMDSKWMFKDNHQYTEDLYTFSGTTGGSGQKKVTLNSKSKTDGIKVGWLVSGQTLTGQIPDGSRVATIASDKKSFTIDKNLTAKSGGTGTVLVKDRQANILTQLSATPSLTDKPTVSTSVKDMFNSSSRTESAKTKTQDKTQPNGSIQASAIVINGVKNPTGTSNDYLSYIYKNYSSEVPAANTFGTRMRILGKQNSDKDSTIVQIPLGAEVIDTIKTSTESYSISGTGGGIAINLNSIDANTNVGYYFELVALTSSTILDSIESQTDSVTTIPNVYFYKVMEDAIRNVAVPVTLWYGTAPVLVDDGLFIGMNKMVGDKSTTVYDLCVKTEELARNGDVWSRRFYLYINNKLIATVTDENAIPLVDGKTQNMALFVRGGGKCLFEHVYAIQEEKSSQLEIANSPINKALGVKEQNFDNNIYRKYLINPTVIELFLSGVSSNGQNKHRVYYEEFGTIMRECAYFNVRYDKAYPALYSKVSPTFNERQGYLVSGFRANPYGAEFLIFNITDFALNLDETSGNYLRIQGITFTQQSTHDLTVDEYFLKNSSLDNYNNYSELNNRMIDIQNSRNTYGQKDFAISGVYLQSAEAANNMMKWVVDKVMIPKKSIGVKIFANPTIQLGDIVTIDYDIDNVQQLPNSRFVVYHIEYSRSNDGPEMSLYLSEVI